MKQPTEHKKLSLKEIIKKHKKNIQDKELHKIIEGKGVDKERFEALLKKAVITKPSK